MFGRAVFVLAIAVLISIEASTDDREFLTYEENEAYRSIEQIGSSLNDFHDNRDGYINNILSLLEGTSVNSKVDLSNITSACKNDLTQWLENVIGRERNAIKMRDSWAVRQGGIYEGNVRWMGHYQECIGAISSNITTQYCTTYFGPRYVPVVRGIPIDVSFASCFPETCSAVDVNYVIGAMTSTRLNQLQTNCPKVDKTLDWFGYTFIVIASVCGLLNVLGTLYALTIKKETKHERKIGSVLRCFSVLDNGRDLLSTKTPRGAIKVIDGIRVISTLWVLLGHSFDFAINRMDNLATGGQQIINGFGYMAIINASFSVDTFFCIGGLLTAYLLLKRCVKNGRMDNVLKLYLLRYLRLTPSVFVLIMFATGMFKYLGSGPAMARYAQAFHDVCYQDWWTNILYINDLYPLQNVCFQHTWYLANDMQFYILSPLFIYAFWKSTVVGTTAVVAFIAGSIAVTTYVSYTTPIMPIAVYYAFTTQLINRLFVGWPVNPDMNTWRYRFETDIYFVPWARISAYLIGMLAGFLLFKTDRKLKISKTIACAIWFLAISCGFSVIYALWGNVRNVEQPSAGMDAFYGAASRPVWSACIAWVIVACTCQLGGPITEFLSWKAFASLSKLTFSAYLIHPVVIYWYFANDEKLTHFTNINMTFNYIGVVVITFGLAFIFACGFEWPAMKLVKMLLPNNNAKLNGDKKDADLSKKYNEFVQQDKKSGHVNNAFEKTSL